MGGREELLSVHVTEMKGSSLLGLGLFMLVRVNIDLRKLKLRVHEEEVLLSLGVALADIVTAGSVRVALDAECKVPYESSRKFADRDGTAESMEPLKQTYSGGDGAC